MEKKNKGSEMTVITKAKELSVYSYRVSMNTDNFPKKARHSIVDEVNKTCLYIHNKLLKTNSIRAEQKEERSETITEAIYYCDVLLFYIELSMNLQYITAKRADYWSGLVHEVKRMAAAWRKTYK